MSQKHAAGDYLPKFGYPDDPAPGKPWRLRWKWFDRDGNGHADEAQSRISDKDCYEKAMRKIATMQAKLKGKGIAGEMYLFDLLDTFAASKINARESSQDAYGYVIARIKLRLKGQDMMIGSLDPDELQAAFSPSNGCTGSGTDTKAVAFLFSALDYAIDTGKLVGVPNPAKRLQAPEYTENTRAPLTKSDMETILSRPDWTHTERLQWTLWFYTSARIGEMCGLRWSDRRIWADFRDERNYQIFPDSTVPMLHIRRKIPAKGMDMRLKSKHEVKTGRPVTLTPYITHLMDLAFAEQRAAGYTGDVMFPSSDKTFYRPHSMRRDWFIDRLVKLGFATVKVKAKTKTYTSQYTPHEIRHSGISLREGARLNHYMVEEVGHTLPGVHAKYVSLHPDTRAKEAQLLSAELQKLAMRGKTDGKTENDQAA